MKQKKHERPEEKAAQPKKRDEKFEGKKDKKAHKPN